MRILLSMLCALSITVVGFGCGGKSESLTGKSLEEAQIKDQQQADDEEKAKFQKPKTKKK
jgi:hypothetical protein